VLGDKKKEGKACILQYQYSGRGVPGGAWSLTTFITFCHRQNKTNALDHRFGGQPGQEQVSAAVRRLQGVQEERGLPFVFPIPLQTQW